MVFLEALTLKTPIASTDIPGAVAVLGEANLGKLVSQSLDGVVEAIRYLSSPDVRHAEFDPDAYLEETMQNFEKVVVGG